MRLYVSSLVAALAASTFSLVTAKSGPINVAYVEVNNDPIIDVGSYTLSDGSNAFDIGIIFAANINYNGSAAVLYNNPQVQSVLDNASSQIQPLQAKGIKVLLSLLGNHQGAGVSNFASQQAAADFASQVADTINMYSLDGCDLDDEYADYGTNGTPQPNSQSIGWFISALRSEMPDKLITFYNYGPASSYLSSSDASIGSQLSYAWNAVYDTYSAPSIPGLGNSQLSAAAVDIQSTPVGDAVTFAQDTLSNGYGAYMTYALPSGDDSSYITQITQALYNLGASYSS